MPRYENNSLESHEQVVHNSIVFTEARYQEMLINVQQAALLVVDVQEKLTPSIKHSQTLLANCRWLMEFAKEITIPILVSEHYAKGLGQTVAPLRELVGDDSIIEKVHFSCAAEPECMTRINSLQRQQIILIGIETHVCILQTAILLVAQGKDVFVVADAVGSRKTDDHLLGLQRMRSAGVQVVSKEMVFFESLVKAGTDQFRQLSQRFMKNQTDDIDIIYF